MFELGPSSVSAKNFRGVELVKLNGKENIRFALVVHAMSPSDVAMTDARMADTFRKNRKINNKQSGEAQN